MIEPVMQSVVYFILGRESIKIGTSRNIKARFQNLQTASSEPLRLLGTVPGAADHERKLHARLKSFHRRGEWFVDCDELRAIIVSICGSDVFAEQPKPHPAESTARQWTLLEVCDAHLAYCRTRLTDYSEFCLNEEKLLTLRLAKRGLIIAAFKYAYGGFETFCKEFDSLRFTNESAAVEASAKACSTTEQLECHIELILGQDDPLFLEGWAAETRINPNFMTENGRLIWRSTQDAINGGWARESIEDRLIVSRAA